MTLQMRGNLTSIRSRSDTEVMINGVTMAFKDLEPGMRITLTMAEPGVAARIEASGDLAFPAATGAESKPAGTADQKSSDPREALRSKLAGTTWDWPDLRMSKGKAWFRLNADGSATAGWHPVPGFWHVVSGDTIELRIRVNPGVETIRFDAALKRGVNVNATNAVYMARGGPRANE